MAPAKDRSMKFTDHKCNWRGVEKTKFFEFSSISCRNRGKYGSDTANIFIFHTLNEI